MSFRLVPKSITLNDLDGVIANRRVISPNSVAFVTDTIQVFMYVLTSSQCFFCISQYIYGVVVKSSRSLSHLLMSFLLFKGHGTDRQTDRRTNRGDGVITFTYIVLVWSYRRVCVLRSTGAAPVYTAQSQMLLVLDYSQFDEHFRPILGNLFSHRVNTESAASLKQFQTR